MVLRCSVRLEYMFVLLYSATRGVQRPMSNRDSARRRGDGGVAGETGCASAKRAAPPCRVWVCHWMLILTDARLMLNKMNPGRVRDISMTPCVAASVALKRGGHGVEGVFRPWQVSLDGV
jgi:hypothetical protein